MEGRENVTAIEKKLKLSNVDMMTLLGVNDQNISLIESYFTTVISVRGENILLRGTPEEIEILEKVFNELAFLVNKNRQLTQQDIELVIQLAKNGKEVVSDTDIDSAILFTKNDVIKAKTPGQFEFIKVARKNDIVFAIGPAGTGKTYLSVALAVAAFKNHLVSKIVLCRPAVEAGESLGFLPGDFREKIDPYLRPLYDALEDMMPYEKLKYYLERNQIEIVPLAYMRGRTLNNAFVILDEAQNATALQMKMFLTRLGANSKAIITGDVTQIDLPSKKESGLVQAQTILAGIDGVAFVYFTKQDVVRHKLVKDILNAYEKYQNGNNNEKQNSEVNK
ncbi:MAG: PhoH family protein [Ignavibacteria bacterium]|jgi:phosphate starvation-inducible PhoH-like protein|nr:PhoH family protein [Ignavibacteria bacterium]MDH7527065.1 PhoH family protein [Ignavibacteria bacterium]